MQLAELLQTLKYDDSPNLLRKGDGQFESAPAYGHIFRHAARESSGGSPSPHLEAVYTLRPPADPSPNLSIPIVYICEASSDHEADESHRLVWNQDVVPFVLVSTPHSVRLYSGFRYGRPEEQPAKALLRTLTSARETLELSKSLGADAIDSGAVWTRWGKAVHPEGRVNWRLLDSLKKLDDRLQSSELDPEVSHALIGKYVYLHYLKDRSILSKRKLQSWGIAEKEVFGRQATLAGLEKVVDRLDEWLNGGVFPISFRGKNAPRKEHVRQVAATFSGDAPQGEAGWQYHLDFQAYDFSYIPIETLSVVYEQFLHMPDKDGKTTKGKDAGAYYTPIPVVNFMLAEMQDRRPLSRGMKILDPSCGSGAFLVQCYRRLIETEYPAAGRSPGPIELRTLLQEHIFGVDRDADACSVTELSLVLTLLDYVDPPDLENDKRVKLPALRGANIFCQDFFDADSQFRRLLSRAKFDWVVGNPPWRKLSEKKLDIEDKPAWDWIQGAAQRGTPVARNQVAQAFAWEAADCLLPDGQAGLLLPAMTLFEDHSDDFRAGFLKKCLVQSVANFANLAEVLFAGRSRVPAAAVFFCPASGDELREDECVTVYSPLVANQELTRPVKENTRQETWNLVLNASEVRDIAYSKVSTGSSLPWKLATWGSELDEKLLKRLARRFPTLGQLEQEGLFVVSEGLQLREGNAKNEELDPVPEVVGKNTLDVRKLEELRLFFVFPSQSLSAVPPELGFARKGRVALPLSVCRPPHVIASAARNFAVYSDDFTVVPPRQIGIISPSKDRPLLKALSLFLSSDFAFYHQFLTSTQFGVQRGRATLDALRRIPVPLSQLSTAELDGWASLHTELARASLRRLSAESPNLWYQNSPPDDVEDLVSQLNNRVYEALDLSGVERALVEDLVRVKLGLNDGKQEQRAAGPPNLTEMTRYARALKTELDSFIEDTLPGSHSVRILYDSSSAMIEIGLQRGKEARNGVELLSANGATSKDLKAVCEELRTRWSQWVYFDRNLRVYEQDATYMFKPMQRFHWTVSQALNDAGDLIAETLSATGGKR